VAAERVRGAKRSSAVDDNDQQGEHAADAERKVHEAHSAYSAASRDFAATQEALGAAEDELAAAEATRDAAERETPPRADTSEPEQRLHEAERAWEGRMDTADRAADRRRDARQALDAARAARDSSVRDGAGRTDQHPHPAPEAGNP
jgi:hypothetical protein